MVPSGLSEAFENARTSALGGSLQFIPAALTRMPNLHMGIHARHLCASHKITWAGDSFFSDAGPACNNTQVSMTGLGATVWHVAKASSGLMQSIHRLDIQTPTSLLDRARKWSMLCFNEHASKRIESKTDSRTPCQELGIALSRNATQSMTEKHLAEL